MIKVTQRALRAICKSLAILPEKLEFLAGGRADSYGILYTYFHNGRKRVLKITALNEIEHYKLKETEIRTNFAYHLSGYGVQVVAPLKTPNGELLVTVTESSNIYIACIMDFFEGTNLTVNNYNEETIANWGTLIGNIHRISKNFTEGKNYDRLNVHGEIETYRGWCRNETVSKAWFELESYVATLDRDVDDYGFIHNDNQEKNVLLKDNNIVLMDFNISGYNFYLNDIVAAAMGIMFEKSGGMMIPYTNPLPLQRFLSVFLNAYLQENSLPKKWFSEITNFVNYRRIKLFTCLQEWLDTEPELKENMLRNIADPPDIVL